MLGDVVFLFFVCKRVCRHHVFFCVRATGMLLLPGLGTISPVCVAGSGWGCELCGRERVLCLLLVLKCLLCF